MTTLTFEIRAAAFYRIIGNIQTAMQSGEKMQSELLEDAEVCEYKRLLFSMIIQMNCDGAVAVFPTVDRAVLSEMVLYIAQYYKCHPEIASNISTMCFGHENARSRETGVLNENLRKLGKLIGDRTDFTVSTEFVYKSAHIFHPDSQFIRVTAIVI